MTTFREQLYPYRWWLPVVAALLTIVAFPPFGATPTLFVALVPLYSFLATVQTRRAAAVGGGTYALIFSGYLTAAVMGGFSWIEGATLFTTFAHLFATLLVVGTTAIAAGWGAMVVWLTNRYRGAGVRMVAFSTFVLIEAVLSAVLHGFNYGALGYAGVAFPGASLLAPYGGSFGIALVLILVNVLVAEALCVRGTYRRLAALLFATLGVVGMSAPPAAWVGGAHHAGSTTTVALIQDAARDPEYAFGRMEAGAFTHPALEAHLAAIAARDTVPAFIIYPFNPWSGVLGSAADNYRFDRTVIAVEARAFSDWLRTHVPAESVFVTWYTVYEDGNFYNEIGYWQNGERIALSRKQSLFPFFDYTPAWAERLGIVSTPIDGTAASPAAAPTVSGVTFGGIICSELFDASLVASRAVGNDVLLSIGSEAMFTHEIPSVYALRQALLASYTSGVPVIRANRFGPSAVITPDGGVIELLPYGTTGVLYATVPLRE